ncbi:MAG: M48 family metalloprotease [Planctomycetes bacterium]|nr:M48 family metalloprotease [Planctomycetota bacterium]
MNIARPALLILIACTALLAACQVDPLTGKNTINLYSYEDEKAMGDENVQPIIAELGGLYPDMQTQQYVDGIGQAVVKAGRTRLKEEAEFPDWDFQFYVVNTSMINAFALPGGHVFVTRGILNQIDDEAELAGLLGHEVTHVFARHGVERMSEQTLMLLPLALLSAFEETQGVAVVGIVAVQLLSMSYGRADEEESDHFGMRFAARAGYHPAGVIGVMQMLKEVTDAAGGGPPEFLSTHPDPGNRVKYLTEQLNKEYPNADNDGRYARNGGQFTTAMVDMRAAQPAYDLADQGDAIMSAGFEAHNGGDAAGAEAKYREALDLYRRAAAMQAGHSILHVNVAQAQFYLGDYASAETAARRALDLDGSAFWPNFMGGLIAIKNEQNGVAQARLQNALKLVPGSPVGLYYLAVSYDREDDRANAVLNYRKTYDAMQGEGDLAANARTRLIELGEPDPAGP